MKPKNHGMISFAIMTILLVGIGAYHQHLVPSTIWTAAGRPAGSTDLVQAPGAAQIRRMHALIEEVEDLSVPKAETAEPVSLSMFGYVDFNPDDSEALAGGLESAIQRSSVLTFAFSAEHTGFCILDGHYYQQGDSLPDGSIVQRIEGDRVLIKDANQATWIPMERPLPGTPGAS